MPITEIYYDVQGKGQVGDDGNEVNSAADLFQIAYTEKDRVLGVHLQQPDGSAWALNGDETFAFATDDDYDSGSTPAISAANSAFNVAGDWDSLSVVNGKISLRLDAFTSELQTILGSAASKTLKADISIYAAGETRPRHVLPLELLCWNAVNPAGGTPAGNTANYYTSAEVDALLAAYRLNNEFDQAAIAGTTIASNTIQTVASGKLFLPQRAIVMVSAIAGSGNPPTGKFTAAGVDLMSARQLTGTAQYQVDVYDFVPGTFIVAGDALAYAVTAAATYSTYTVRAFVQGVHVDA